MTESTGANAPRWRVCRVDRGRVLARFEGVDEGAPRVVATARDGTLPAVVGEALSPAVGDWLLPAPTEQAPERMMVAPRVTELARDSTDRTSRTQVLAANVDVVVIAEHLDPDPALGRVERLLALTWRAGAAPLVVLTKADLAHDADHWVMDIARAAPGAPVVAVSAVTGEGMDALRGHIRPGDTMVIVGPSGAGKSTLVNALAGAEIMAAGERRGDGKGRHTTTHRELVPLPGGGVLIDTPGLRAVGIVADADAVDQAFPDVAALSEQCHFRDCAHEREPDCAVLAAVESGELGERRFDSWRRLQRESAHQAARADARLAAQSREVWKKRAKGKREHRRLRGH